MRSFLSMFNKEEVWTNFLIRLIKKIRFSTSTQNRGLSDSLLNFMHEVGFLTKLSFSAAESFAASP